MKTGGEIHHRQPAIGVKPGRTAPSNPGAPNHHRQPPMTAATLTATDALTTSVTCPFCSGSGKLPHFSHVANGDCFACGASGELRDLTAFIGSNSDMMLTVWVNNGAFSGAELRRRTWKTSKCSVGSGSNQTIGLCKTWGRDSFCRVIESADQAREIWRNARRLGILTELVD